jgi:hypothetical protein
MAVPTGDINCRYTGTFTSMSSKMMPEDAKFALGF